MDHQGPSASAHVTLGKKNKKHLPSHCRGKPSSCGHHTTGHIVLQTNRWTLMNWNSIHRHHNHKFNVYQQVWDKKQNLTTYHLTGIMSTGSALSMEKHGCFLTNLTSKSVKWMNELHLRHCSRHIALDHTTGVVWSFPNSVQNLHKTVQWLGDELWKAKNRGNSQNWIPKYCAQFDWKKKTPNRKYETDPRPPPQKKKKLFVTFLIVEILRLSKSWFEETFQTNA